LDHAKNLEIVWLKDDGPVDPNSLPLLEEVAAEIAEKALLL
jgi:hypothetical protein